MATLQEFYSDPSSSKNKKAAENRLRYWAAKIVELNATNLAGVSVERDPFRENGWIIDLAVYVPRDSPEFIAFMQRFRAL
jgi:hypothetical protein